jgi:hypothetical protein
VKSRVDNRYHAVRSIRSARQAGRELNKAVGPGNPVDSRLGCFLGDDERWFRNYNIHNVERGVNVSCSFNPRSGLCYTCMGEGVGGEGGAAGGAGSVGSVLSS